MQNAEQEVVILLALYNGALHLGAQLDSFAAQTHVNWRLLVSDDGSTDASRGLLDAWSQRHPAVRIELIDGPAAGFVRNFLHLIGAAGPQVPFAAFSDQDDVWLPGKLARGLAALSGVPADQPGLWGSSSWICSANLASRKPSPGHRLPPSFGNALVQSFAGGNTMIINRGGLDLLQQALRLADARSMILPAHDRWIYQIISGAGGQVIYDPEPQILYRQHAGNAIGTSTTMGGWLTRLRALALNDGLKRRNGLNAEALAPASQLFTPVNHHRFQAFVRLRGETDPLARLAAMREAGLFHQNRINHVLLWLAALTGRL